MYYACRPETAEDHSIFLVGQDATGRHCVMETHGLIGGAFVSRAEAVRFAQDESRLVPNSIVLITPELLSIDEPAR